MRVKGLECATFGAYHRTNPPAVPPGGRGHLVGKVV